MKVLNSYLVVFSIFFISFTLTSFEAFSMRPAKDNSWQVVIDNKGTEEEPLQVIKDDTGNIYVSYYSKKIVYSSTYQRDVICFVYHVRKYKPSGRLIWDKILFEDKLHVNMFIDSNNILKFVGANRDANNIFLTNNINGFFMATLGSRGNIDSIKNLEKVNNCIDKRHFVNYNKYNIYFNHSSYVSDNNNIYSFCESNKSGFYSIVKFNSNGDKVYEKNIDDKTFYNLNSNSLTEDIEGNLYIASSVNYKTYDELLPDISTDKLIKINSEGNVVWTDHYDGNYTMIPLSRGLVVDNEGYSYHLLQTNGSVIKRDRSGKVVSVINILNETSVGNNSLRAYRLELSSDNSIYVGGHMIYRTDHGGYFTSDSSHSFTKISKDTMQILWQRNIPSFGYIDLIQSASRTGAAMTDTGDGRFLVSAIATNSENKSYKVAYSINESDGILLNSTTYTPGILNDGSEGKIYFIAGSVIGQDNSIYSIMKTLTDSKKPRSSPSLGMLLTNDSL